MRKRIARQKSLPRLHVDKVLDHATVKRLWRNTELNRDEFNLVYLPMIRRAIEIAANDDERDQILRLASGVMVARGGFRLGKALDTEDSDRISNRFTLALVACVLLEFVIHRGHSVHDYNDESVNLISIAHRVLGSAAFGWLLHCPSVANDVVAYFYEPSDSEIRHVVAKYFSRKENAHYRHLLPSFNIHSAPTEQSAHQPTAEPQPPANTPKPPKSEDGRKTSLARRYLDWLSSMISDGLIAVNEPDSIAHLNGHGELFLVHPLGFDGFARTENKDTTAVTRNLEKKEHLVPNAKSCFHHAVLNGAEVHGVLLKNVNSLLPNLAKHPASEHLLLSPKSKAVAHAYL